MSCHSLVHLNTNFYHETKVCYRSVHNSWKNPAVGGITFLIINHETKAVCRFFGGQKNLKCTSWNKYNQEEKKKQKCYKLELFWNLLKQFYQFLLKPTSTKSIKNK